MYQYFTGRRVVFLIRYRYCIDTGRIRVAGIDGISRLSTPALDSPLAACGYFASLQVCITCDIPIHASHPKKSAQREAHKFIIKITSTTALIRSGARAQHISSLPKPRRNVSLPGHT